MGIAGLLLLAGCAAPDRPRVLFPLPPDEPKIEFLGVYSSQNDFPKGAMARFIESILGAPAPAGFKSPYGIAADSRGVVYVSDMHLHNLRVYDFAAQTVSFYTEEAIFDQPRGLGIDANDNLYVAEGARGYVAVFDRNRKPLHVLGGRSEMNFPVSVAINDRLQRAYVVDAREHKVVVYDLAGSKLFEFGSKGSGHGQFYSPQAVAIAPDDRVFVADMLNARVQSFDAAGKFQNAFGERGDAVYQFENPKGLAFDSDGNLWVADNRRSSIYTYRPDGTLLLATGSASRTTTALGFTNPVSIFIDRNDRIYVTDMLNKRFSVWQYFSKAYLEKHPLSTEDIRKLEELQRKTDSAPPASGGGR